MPHGTTADQEKAVKHAFLVIETLIERIDELGLTIFGRKEEDLRDTRNRLERAHRDKSLAGVNYALHLLAYMPPDDRAVDARRREIAALATELQEHIRLYQLSTLRPRTA